MKLKPLDLIFFAVLAFVAVSLLGGSAIWRLAPVRDLDIDGRAPIVTEAGADMGAGWPAYGGDQGGSRYSAAAQITAQNVSELRQAWTYRTRAFEGREAAGDNVAFEATPILAENALIFCTQFNDVIAVEGACAARVFMGTVDARLLALDARTGALCADFGEGGVVRIEPSVQLRWPGEFQITSAPAVAGDVIIVGSSISDNLRTEAPLGTVHAFDARTGRQIWRFNPVPRDPADPARASWAGDSADMAGHANVWSTMSVDSARGLVFLPTSSPSPDFYGGNRVGDNHYANSVVALRAATGEVVWSFQTVHHDVWDYDVPAQPGLYRVWRDGAARDVVAQVTKTGLVFVLDRETGEPVLPIEERAVPQGGVEGEHLSPTQPFPLATPPLVPDRVSPSDAFGVTLWDRLGCERQLSALRRDGLYTPPSLQGTLLYPFNGGGANWGSAAFDPRRNLLVVNINNIGHAVRLYRKTQDDEVTESVNESEEFAPMEGAPYAMTRDVVLSPLGLPCTPPPWGMIAGVDLSSGEIVWRRTLGTTQDLSGLPLALGTPGAGGPIITGGGLVFIGAAMDNYLRALDVETGREVWKGRLPAGGQATPMTYEWQGRQYVVIAAGGHGRLGTQLGDYLVAFALPN
ncbi:MAG: pyrroloquinoline quinone-dependent dehydrogenase [Hyphomonadaceae bacterium]|nr:pyrroloquinoline quinone-dependent dehydrogenase [Hyphomonadaceae bacterium]